MLFLHPQISAASLGAQTQILGSLTTTPVITSAIPSMPGISSQILTNAQGQASDQSEGFGAGGGGLLKLTGGSQDQAALHRSLPLPRGAGVQPPFCLSGIRSS